MRWIRRALLALAALAVAWLGIVWSGVLPLISAEQRAALAFLRDMPPPPPGRNAFALLWAQPWAVPVGQEESLLAEDVARFREWEARWLAQAQTTIPGGETEPADEFVSIAAERFPRRGRLPDGVDYLCGTEWDADCVGAVARNPAAARAALAAVVDSLALAKRIDAASHLRYGFPPNLDGPLSVAGDWGRIAINAAALRAHDGDPVGALEDLCAFGLTWRRLRTGTDTLVADMIGIAFVRTASTHAVAIHAAAPAGIPWPAACEALIAPLADVERDQCVAARGEFAFTDRHVSDLGPSVAGAGLGERLINAEHLLAKAANRYRALCAAIPGPGDATSECSAIEWPFDPAGCAWLLNTRQGDGGWGTYAVRVDDLDRHLALARAARWWRAQPGAATGDEPTWPEPFAAIRHDITVDPTARTLSLLMRDAGNPRRAQSRMRY